MADELGLKVKITPEIDKTALDREGKTAGQKIERQLQGIKPPKEFSNLLGKLPGGKAFAPLLTGFGAPRGMENKPPEGEGGGFLGGMMGGGKTGGGMGGMGKAGGALLGIFALIEIGKSIMDLIKKAVNILAEASPFLKSTLTLIYKSLLLWLQPIGDMLAMVLLPIARFFLQLRVKYNDQIMGFVKEGKFLEASMVLFAATMAEGLAAIGGWLYESLCDLGTWGLDLLSGFTDWFWTTITDALGDIGSALAGLPNTIYNWIVDGLGGIAGALISLADTFIEGMVTSIANIEVPILGKPFYGLLEDLFPQYFQPEKIPVPEFPHDLYDEWMRALQPPTTTGDEWRDIIQAIGLLPMGNAFGPELTTYSPTTTNTTTYEESTTNVNIAVTNNFNAPIYGVDDIEQAIESGIDEYASKIRTA